MPLLLLGSAAALTRAEVERWPVLYREGEVKQTFTAQEKAGLSALIAALNRKPEVQALKKQYEYFGGLSLIGVQFSLVAPFRSAQPERLTVFDVYRSEPPIALVVLSSGTSSAWLIEPKGNMNICGWHQGYTLRDLDLNGQREFALVVGCGDGPNSGLDLDLFGWSKGNLKLWGGMSASSSTPDGDDLGAVQMTVNRSIYVQKGRVPRFAAVTTEQRTRWTETGPPQRLSTRTFTEPVRLDDQTGYRVRRLW
ncbi:hypothetical protein C8263_08870 [Deinococcus arcticus]|uniref:Uncharacterized protein n=1 Tax=Deinococcus arcticus TaxID=2136176 RepID=A0A2T3W8U1_9DEIO|nr:hypothetical protein C8263_08870 [Deinococcus arcticus]